MPRERITSIQEITNRDLKRIGKTKNLYIYGKYKDEKLLYKECFLKTDIDGVPIKFAERKHTLHYKGR